MSFNRWLLGFFRPTLPELMDEIEQMFTVTKDREPEPGWADMPMEYPEEAE